MRALVRAVVVAALAATTVILPAGPALADEDSIRFTSGEAHATLGPSQVLRVDGRIRYFNNCSAPANGGGIDDFVYPAADIYVINSDFDPSDGDNLVDETGTPTTIVQAGGTFVDEILAITQPSGSLPEGEYSIVVDTCQNGVFNASSDLLLHGVISVRFPPVLPPIDSSIIALKNSARTAFGTWQDISRLFDTLLAVDKAAGCGKAAFERGNDLQDAILGCLEVINIWVDSPAVSKWLELTGKVKNAVRCKGNDAGACFGLISDFWGLDGSPIRTYVTSGAKNLIANQAKAFFGIAADPPRADYSSPSSVIQPDLPIPQVQGDGLIFDWVSQWATALEREQLMWTALLAAVERYQGAQAAGAAADAVAQARSAANLADTLADASPVTANLLAAWFDTVHTKIPDFDTITQAGCADLHRYDTSGFSPAEDRALRNWGVAGAARNRWLDTLRGETECFLSAPFMNTGSVAALVGGQGAQSATLHATATALRSTADSVTGPDAAGVPTITLPAATNAAVGMPVTVTAVATPGSTVAWDLDNDGVFDDATGPSATVSYAMAGHRVVAAKATNAVGVAVTAHALVDVILANRPPAIDSFTPAGINGRPYATTAVGVAQTFTVAASDPEGDALRYDWFVDGDRQDGATGPSLTVTPNATDRGPHTVSVQVQDPHPGNVATQAWRWQVDDADRDRDGWADNPVADCNDTNAAVHPGQVEVLFNGWDDDCNAATPDRPLDLGDGGDVWTWGQSYGSGRGDTATPGPNSVHDAVQIAGSFRLGYALLSDGTVRGWGIGGNGLTGISPTGKVYGLGSASGELSGVTGLTESTSAVFFQLADGHVASVGDETGGYAAGQLGAGIGLYGRNYSDYVLGPDTDGDGAADPLSDVVKVWNIGGAGLAQQADGTLLQWGSRQCADAGWGVRPVVYAAVPEPDLTAKLPGLVQAVGSINNPGSALFRLADGSVKACGAERAGWSEYTFNRLMPFGAFGPDDPAVDVATRGNEWWVVTAPGEVWVKTWDAGVLGVPGCTPALCPAGKLFQLPVPGGARVVDVDADGDTIQLRRADGTLVTWGGNTYWNTGHPTPTNSVPAAIPAQLEIDGYVLESHSSIWNGYALVIPSARIAASGWVPPQPDVTVSAVGGTGPEGGSATAGVRLNRPASGDLTVSWRFGDATGEVAVPAGDTEADIPLTLPAPDGVWGIDRHQPLMLSSVSANATLGDENADMTITDTDPVPTLTVSPDSVPEGDGALTAATITVGLSRPAGIDLVAHVTSTDGTAAAGVDYKPVVVDVPIPAGTTAVTAPLVLLGNTIPQPDRTFTVAVSVAVPVAGAGGADPAEAIGPISRQVTIVDDDPLALRANSVIVAAGDTATVSITSPTLPTGEQVTVDWATTDGTALAGRDYTAASGTLTLAPTAGGGGKGIITVPTALLTAASDAERGHRLALTLAVHTAERAVLGPTSTTIVITRRLDREPQPDPGPVTPPVTTPVSPPNPAPDPLPSSPTTSTTPPAATLMITVRAPRLHRGETQTAIGAGFAPGEPVDIEMHSDAPIPLGTVVADPDGTLSISFPVPARSAIGEHTITLTGASSGAITGSFQVLADDAGFSEVENINRELATTGPPVVPQALFLAALALLAGIGLVRAARRGRRNPARSSR